MTDSDNDLPIPEVAVSLVYWQGKESVEEKKEIELKTDKNGIAEFPKVEAKKMVVTVSAKGYRPFWRWFRPNGLQELSRIRLQKWASTAFRERTHQ